MEGKCLQKSSTDVYRPPNKKKWTFLRKVKFSSFPWLLNGLLIDKNAIRNVKKLHPNDIYLIYAEILNILMKCPAQCFRFTEVNQKQDQSWVSKVLSSLLFFTLWMLECYFCSWRMATETVKQLRPSKTIAEVLL